MSSMLSGSASLGGPTGNNQSLKGTGYKQAQLQNFSPEQMQLFQRMFSQVGPDSYLGKLAGGDQSTFSQIEAPAYEAFGQLQGNLGSRFSGMGSFGSRKSSGFQNTMGGAASSLSQSLASNRQSLQQQAIKDLMGMSKDLLNQNPYHNFLMPEQEDEPWWSKAAGIGLPVAGAVAGGIFGGPMGAIGGASAGNAFASGLRGKQSSAIDWKGISALPNKWGI